MVGPALATICYRGWLAIRYNFCVSTKGVTPNSNLLRPFEETDVRLIRQLLQRECRRARRRSIEVTLRMHECVDRVRLATMRMRVGPKLFDLLIPKAIAVVEMDVTETSVLKLFDQSIVSCEFVNELCPHMRPLHR